MASELSKRAQPYYEILIEMRRLHPNLRDDQLFMAMFLLEDMFEEDIRDIAKEPAKLAALYTRDITQIEVA